MVHFVRTSRELADAAVPGRRLAGWLPASFAMLFWLTGCAAEQARTRTEPKLIDRTQSRLDVRIDGIANDRLRYYYLGWNENFSYERYAVAYADRGTGQYLFGQVQILANDEYYISNVAPVTVETIRSLRYFRDKAIDITFRTSGMNAGSDTAAGGANYMLFTAGGSSCMVGKRVSSLGEHGGTEIPRSVLAVYCAPAGEKVSRDRAAAITKGGLIFVEKPSGGEPG